MTASRPQPRPGDIWYFAYGSNLSVKQKEQRTGKIRAALRCRLPGHRFAFNKRSRRNELAANILPTPGHDVWGVAYLRGPEAMRLMDRYEGVSAGDYGGLNNPVRKHLQNQPPSRGRNFQKHLAPTRVSGNRHVTSQRPSKITQAN